MSRESREQKPKLAVWKFASCDGCQLSLLDCEDELLAVAGEIEIANFLEASRAVVNGPYDLSLVEGSITTPHDAERIHAIRRASKFLVTIGACATAGGIQALRNFKDVKEFISIVYATPKYIDVLNTSTPISEHVHVDFELRGCPINKHQLIEVISAYLHGRKPNTPPHSVCGMQAARDGVCDGRTAHPLSWTRHPRRVRRDLPVVLTRLLRLLRAKRNAEYDLVKQSLAAAGREQARHHPCFP